MSVHAWADLDRSTLSELLPTALVILPVGAIEQHGDHLPSGTDAKLATAVARAAAELAASGGGSFIVAPTLSVGASEHHLPFGGTISVRVETMLALLIDVVTSMARSGATRVVVVNGHGGNSGVCHAAASAASARLAITVAHVDYWSQLGGSTGAVPGHAGEFETSMILALEPDLVRSVALREGPSLSHADPAGVSVHANARWAEIDGFTDQPALASVETGTEHLRRLVENLAAAFSALGSQR